MECCTFHDNSAGGIGGAIGVESGAFLQIRDCHFSKNTGGAGGAICVAAGSAVISECFVDSNSADFGGGINIMSATRATIERTVVVGNTASFAGGGIYTLYGEDVSIVNCTVADNTCEAMGGGIYSSSSNALLENTIVASSGGAGGIYFGNGNECTIRYCDFWANSDDDFLGEIPIGLGILTAVNANGDSCDGSFNIFQDPMFVAASLGDYHLLALSSCIDAGNPASPSDPDGSVSDIGAFSFDRGFLIWCSLNSGALVLEWYPLPQAFSYWVYGASGNAWFDPEFEVPYTYLLEILPEGASSWSSTAGVADPTVNWSYLIIAAGQSGEELYRSNRVGEHEFLLIP